MASHGIKDRVAIVGMGCTRFAESWDKSADDLLVEATQECFASTPRLPKEDVDAYWLGTMNSGQSGVVLSRPVGIDYKPVTRVENMCATGSEAIRSPVSMCCSCPTHTVPCRSTWRVTLT